MGNDDLMCAINAHLFIPLDGKIIERLQYNVMQLLLEADINMVEDCTYSFFINVVSPDFRNSFDMNYQKLYKDSLFLPDIVYVILEIFFVRKCIEADDISANVRRKYSCVVRNFAVLLKGRWSNLKCSDWVIGMYKYSNVDIDKSKHTGTPSQSFLNSILPYDNWDDTGLDISNINIFRQIHDLCIVATKNHFNNFIDSFAFLKYSSPFVRVYMLFCKMMNNYDWKYLSIEPPKIIISTMGKASTEKKKFRRIVDIIRNELNSDDLYKPTMKSSVLLRKVFSNYHCGIEECMFSVLEFGIYLYYELLLESYND